MIVEPWVERAVKEILEDGITFNVEQIKAIIALNCPFEEGVAYMPVPRCETCAHWSEFRNVDGEGECKKMQMPTSGGVYYLQTTADFGCVQWKAR